MSCVAVNTASANIVLKPWTKTKTLRFPGGLSASCAFSCATNALSLSSSSASRTTKLVAGSPGGDEASCTSLGTWLGGTETVISAKLSEGDRSPLK